MKSDLSRDTFDPAKHLTRVLMQQGRVTLDADLNEQVAILLHYLWALAEDVIGPCAAPINNGGFELKSIADGRIFTISPGRYYVDGILVENETELGYTEQADYAWPVNDPLRTPPGGGTQARFVAYLDVWERHITPIEDPVIREVALGGPDTCNRAKIVWQVKVAPVVSRGTLGHIAESPQGPPGEVAPEGAAAGSEGAATEAPQLAASSECTINLPHISAASLAAHLDPGPQIPDPCVLPPDSKYLGLENQLYRVEIHQPGPVGTATFKWSRDNGSVVTAWLNTDGNDLLVASTRGFAPGNWVELSDETLDLHGEPGILVKLTKVEAGILSVDPMSLPKGATLDWTARKPFPKVRRWDQVATEDIALVDGAVPVKEKKVSDLQWIALEDGLQVRFASPAPAASLYRTGDYWLIPARVATGQIEWPTEITPAGEVPRLLGPHGVWHHYAPLGLGTWDGKTWTVADTTCRCTFSPVGTCP